MSVEARETELRQLEAEVKALEGRLAEHEAAKKALETLEGEAAEASHDAEKVADKIAKERRSKAQLEQKEATLNAAARDPAVLQRTLAVLKKRTEALEKLHAACNDPQTTINEEEGLARQHQELARLTKDRQLHSRELKQRARQLEALTAQADNERLLARGDAAQEFEAYITRLREMERRGKESSEQRAKHAKEMEDEWARWLELLCSCARTLQARADAGEEAAALGNTETPAASVLDAVHRSEQKRGQLKGELRQGEATERALNARIQKIQGKIAQQRLAAKGEKPGGAAAAPAAAPAPI